MKATYRIYLVALWSIMPIFAILIGVSVCKNALVSFFLYHGICLVPAIIWGFKTWSPGWVRPKPSECIKLLIVAVLFNVLVVFGNAALGSYLYSPQHAQALLQEYCAGSNLLLLGGYGLLVNPLLEEIFWRGIVFIELERKNKLFGLIWSSCGYAALHYPIFRLVLNPAWAGVLTIGHVFYGMLLARYYKRTGSIVMTALAHGLFTDLPVVFLVLHLLKIAF